MEETGVGLLRRVDSTQLIDSLGSQESHKPPKLRFPHTYHTREYPWRSLNLVFTAETLTIGRFAETKPTSG